MKLKSFGCSFIYGSDLADCPLTIDDAPSQSTWPALVAKHYDLAYFCRAWPGIGNLRIAESVLAELAIDPTPSVYVIGWSWADRFDYTDPDYEFSRLSTMLPSDESSHAQYYYKHLHSEYRDKLTTLINIKTAQDAVLAAGHKLIMTYMDQTVFSAEWHAGAAVKLLQNAVKPKMTLFENQTFLDWTKAHGHKISPGWHPLESAHRAAADLIINYNLV